MPVLVPGGRCPPLARAPDEHRAAGIRFAGIPGAGHFLSKEQPLLLSRELIGLFTGRTDPPRRPS
ncbi:hypothetical protein ACFU6R_17030 [Streptomyces sp. NPDC057499]|uniref:hypothetical protein n=1 Tax=Streptomyces sp. NPDC057499 TaxID=3346150 RepID=UPI00367D80DA